MSNKIASPFENNMNLNILTVGNNNTHFDYLWCGGYLYVPEIVSNCPNYKMAFVYYNASITDLDRNMGQFRLLGAALANNTIEKITIEAGSTCVVGSVANNHRATFIANSSFSVYPKYDITATITIDALLDCCVKNYNQDLIGKNHFKKQIRECADKALQKLTVFFIMVSAGVILLSSYYNVYKILTSD